MRKARSSCRKLMSNFFFENKGENDLQDANSPCFKEDIAPKFSFEERGPSEGQCDREKVRVRSFSD